MILPVEDVVGVSVNPYTRHLQKKAIDATKSPGNYSVLQHYFKQPTDELALPIVIATMA
jgi:hypothetical protein